MSIIEERPLASTQAALDDPHVLVVALRPANALSLPPTVDAIREAIRDRVAFLEAIWSRRFFTAWTVASVREPDEGYVGGAGEVPVGEHWRAAIVLPVAAARAPNRRGRPCSVSGLIEAPLWRALAAAVVLADHVLYADLRAQGCDRRSAAALAAERLATAIAPVTGLRYTRETPVRSRGATSSPAASLFTRLRETEGPQALRALLGARTNVKALGQAWRLYARAPETDRPPWWHDAALDEVASLVSILREAGATATAVRDIRAAAKKGEAKADDIEADLRDGVVGALARLDLPQALALAVRYEIDISRLYGHHRYAAPLLAAGIAVGAWARRGIKPADPLARWGLQAIATAFGGARDPLLDRLRAIIAEAMAEAPPLEVDPPKRLPSRLEVLRASDDILPL
jgi:hypothetical protein